MEYTMNIKLLENECWWGGCSDDGIKAPFCENSEISRNLDPNNTYNQASPLLVSNKGRYIWGESAYTYKIEKDELVITGIKEKPQIFEGGSNLRETYLLASQRFFPTSKVAPPKEFFDGIQYNSWIELMYNQNQEGIINYAKKIKEEGYPTKGVFMIDCGWNDYYGKFEFSTSKFTDPKAMVDELHAMGYKVMLWTCPFISADTAEFRYAWSKGYLIMNKWGLPSIKQWWDGFSSVVDITNPEVAEWYYQQHKYLMDKYGIDGFKLDAGDGHFYSDDDVIYAKTDSNGQSEAWAKFGLRFKYNEYRACWKAAGLELVHRLRDKNHSWTDNGVAALVPCQLAQGILGYAYTCPDMIGGGQFTDFLEDQDKLDQELFVRYAQCAALMPMTQFSISPWRVLDEYHNGLCRDISWVRMEYIEDILALTEHARKTGEPVVRYMEYVFPNQGFEKVIDQFMLGDNILVAPVMEKGKITREIKFPEGNWKSRSGEIIKGGQTLTVDAPLDVLPIYRKVND
ncbi:MAG: glycoside hydrolase [Ruminococcaceae bacterium]|nr:glycoside hydrolase [Oscillospiraceae bacterium]